MAEVYKDDQSVGLQLVAEGDAVIYDRYLNSCAASLVTPTDWTAMMMASLVKVCDRQKIKTRAKIQKGFGHQGCEH